MVCFILPKFGYRGKIQLVTQIFYHPSLGSLVEPPSNLPRQTALDS